MTRKVNPDFVFRNLCLILYIGSSKKCIFTKNRCLAFRIEDSEFCILFDVYNFLVSIQSLIISFNRFQTVIFDYLTNTIIYNDFYNLNKLKTETFRHLLKFITQILFSLHYSLIFLSTVYSLKFFLWQTLCIILLKFFYLCTLAFTYFQACYYHVLVKLGEKNYQPCYKHNTNSNNLFFSSRKKNTLLPATLTHFIIFYYLISYSNLHVLKRI